MRLVGPHLAVCSYLSPAVIGNVVRDATKLVATHNKHIPSTATVGSRPGDVVSGVANLWLIILP